MDSGYPMTPSVGIEFGGGKPVAGTNTSEEFLHSVQQPLMEALHGKDNVNTVLSSGYQVPQLIHNQFKTDTLGEAQSDRPINIALSDVSELLTVLMNPDALLKSTEGKPPPILPMHRIFSLKDFDSLRGFSGD